MIKIKRSRLRLIPKLDGAKLLRQILVLAASSGVALIAGVEIAAGSLRALGLFVIICFLGLWLSVSPLVWVYGLLATAQVSVSIQPRLFDSAGVIILLSDGFALAAIGRWLLLKIVAKPSQSVPQPPPPILGGGHHRVASLLIGLAVIAFLSQLKVAWGIGIERALSGVVSAVKFFEYIAIAFVLADELQNERQIHRLIQAMLLLWIIQSSFAILSGVFGINPLAITTPIIGRRTTGLLSSTAQAGIFAACGILTSLSLLGTNSRLGYLGNRKSWLAGTLGLTLTALALSGTRGALAGLLLSALFYLSPLLVSFLLLIFLLLMRLDLTLLVMSVGYLGFLMLTQGRWYEYARPLRQPKLWGTIAVFGGIIVGIQLLYNAHLAQRLSEGDVGRQLVLQVVGALVLENPFLGVGWANMRAVVLESYASYYANYSEIVRSAHHAYFQFFVELGVIGGLAFTATIFLVTWEARNTVLETAGTKFEGVARAAHLSLLAIAGFLFFHSWFGGAISLLYFWVYYGMVVAIRRLTVSQDSPNSQVPGTYSGSLRDYPP